MKAGNVMGQHSQNDNIQPKLTLKINQLIASPDAFVGKGNLFPFSGPSLTKTSGLYSSSFPMSAEFSNRFNMACLP